MTDPFEKLRAITSGETNPGYSALLEEAKKSLAILDKLCAMPDWMDEFIIDLEDGDLSTTGHIWLRHIANPMCKDDMEISQPPDHSTLKEVAELAYQHLEKCGK